MPHSISEPKTALASRPSASPGTAQGRRKHDAGRSLVGLEPRVPEPPAGNGTDRSGGDARVPGPTEQGLAHRTDGRSQRVVRSWPLLALALPAAIAVWSGWVGSGG
jgi:hypothetical protein